MEPDSRHWTPVASPDLSLADRQRLVALADRSDATIVRGCLAPLPAIGLGSLLAAIFVPVDLDSWWVSAPLWLPSIVRTVSTLRFRRRHHDKVITGLAGRGDRAHLLTYWVEENAADLAGADLMVRTMVENVDGADLLTAVQKTVQHAATPPVDAASLTWNAARIAVAYDNARRLMPGLAGRRRAAGELDLTSNVGQSLIAALLSVATLMQTARRLGEEAAQAPAVTAELDQAVAIAASLAELDQAVAAVTSHTEPLPVPTSS